MEPDTDPPKYEKFQLMSRSEGMRLLELVERLFDARRAVMTLNDERRFFNDLEHLKHDLREAE